MFAMGAVACAGEADTRVPESESDDVTTEIDYYYANCEDVPGSVCANEKRVRAVSAPSFGNSAAMPRSISSR